MSGVLQSICLKLPKCAEGTQIASALAAVTANTTDSCGDCTAEKLSPRCHGAHNTADVSSASTSGSRVGKGGGNEGVAGVVTSSGPCSSVSVGRSGNVSPVLMDHQSGDGSGGCEYSWWLPVKSHRREVGEEGVRLE